MELTKQETQKVDSAIMSYFKKHGYTLNVEVLFKVASKIVPTTKSNSLREHIKSKAF
jgi:hypothetical protein